MLNLGEFLTIRITGNNSYDCLISPSWTIVSEVPENSYLHGKNFQDIYSENKDKIKIGPISIPDQPILLDSDKYPGMLEKNFALGYLKEKFDCEMI